MPFVESVSPSPRPWTRILLEAHEAEVPISRTRWKTALPAGFAVGSSLLFCVEKAKLEEAFHKLSMLARSCADFSAPGLGSMPETRKKPIGMLTRTNGQRQQRGAYKSGVYFGAVRIQYDLSMDPARSKCQVIRT